MVEPPDDDPGSPLYWQKFFSDANTPFEADADPEPPPFETLRSLYSSVLVNYGYACAMTGAQFSPPAEFLHESLEVAAIRPLAAGGSLHVSNFLCLERRVADAFRAGEIAVGRQHQLIVDLSRIDPELLERLNPLGKLRLPQSEVAQPMQSALDFHREHVFLRNA
ncbi:hypothetical protein [Devosia sp. A449]